mgnify:CR=1 FL=1
MKRAITTGVSFGLPSGTITTLGLIVGLHAGPHSRLAVVGGILTIAVADALCYVFGAFGVIFVCSVIGPRLLGIDLRAEAGKLEAELGGPLFHRERNRLRLTDLGRRMEPLLAEVLERTEAARSAAEGAMWSTSPPSGAADRPP